MRHAKWIVSGAAALLLCVALPVFAQNDERANQKPDERKADERAKQIGGRQDRSKTKGDNSDRERELVNHMQSRGMTLARAISAAEANTGGFAISARAHRDGSDFAVDVDCVVGGQIMHATVDGTTGQVSKSARQSDRDGADRRNAGKGDKDKQDGNDRKDRKKRGAPKPGTVTPATPATP